MQHIHDARRQCRFRSPIDDHAYGVSAENGTTLHAANILKRGLLPDVIVKPRAQFNRPTNPALSSQEPIQEQSQETWSLALEDTLHAADSVDVVGGMSYDKYHITKAQEFNATRGLFEYPKGGSDSFNWQTAIIWRYANSAQIHASVSDRARFPVIFELYSTRFGTATPNPDLGPERATNLEVGWKGRVTPAVRLEANLFYSDVRDLIQTIVLPDTTTQTQNVGEPIL